MASYLDALLSGRWVFAEDAHAAAVGAKHGGQNPQQRGLAGAVRAEQTDNAGFEFEVDSAERQAAVKRLADTAKLNS